MYAQVLPDIADVAMASLYTYIIPPALEGLVVVGGRVTMPLHARQVTGYVFEISTNTELPPEKLRPLLAVKSSVPAFTPEQARLVCWLAHYYLCPLSEALRPCLAEGGRQLTKRRWQSTENQAVQTQLPDPEQQQVLEHVRRHPGVSGSQIRAIFGEAGLQTLEILRRDGRVRPLGGARMKRKEIRALLPALPVEELHRIAEGLRAPRQAQLLHWAAAHLHVEEHVDFTAICSAEAARQAGVSQAVVQACIGNGWLTQTTMAIRRNPWDNVQGRKMTPPSLTDMQQYAVGAINTAILARQAESFLLLGVTGSGKTEVFLHAIETVLAQGRQVIVLVPEISLTAQAMALYHGRFPAQVAVLHSNLSAGERFDEWQRIAAGDASVILGARSAIFAPCPNLGLIIIDEEHETSYKQDSSPRYHAKTVALKRCRLCQAPLVLASATPSLESMREAEIGRHQLLRLPERIASRPLPPVKLVDLRKMTTGARILSAPLRQAITHRLAQQQQVILFLNRRGYSYALLCRECGHFESCPHCAVPLTYHQAEKRLMCHHCDYQLRPHTGCPRCRGVQIAFKGVGTERLEAEVQELWPQARLGRLDRDTTGRKGSHQVILDRFGREETDILIGTQMVAKGFDFPKVTLVGVVAADTSLGIPDFRAPERTFQLLTQVAGRAGRAEWEGEVIVQSWQPEHYAIQAAAMHDYELFYREEIVHRGDSEACWPPLTAMVNVLVNGEIESEVKATAAALTRRAREAGAETPALPAMPETIMLPGLLEFLQTGAPPSEEEPETFYADALLQRVVPDGVVVNDAVPCPFPRLRGRYRYHLILRGQEPAHLHTVAKLLQDITPPKGVFVFIDIDPLTLA